MVLTNSIIPKQTENVRDWLAREFTLELHAMLMKIPKKAPFFLADKEVEPLVLI